MSASHGKVSSASHFHAQGKNGLFHESAWRNHRASEFITFLGHVCLYTWVTNTSYHRAGEGSLLMPGWSNGSTKKILLSSAVRTLDLTLKSRVPKSTLGLGPSAQPALTVLSSQSFPLPDKTLTEGAEYLDSPAVIT